MYPTNRKKIYHVDSAVVDAMLEGADEGDVIPGPGASAAVYVHRTPPAEISQEKEC